VGERKLEFRHWVSATAIIEFNEIELRALDGLTGYSMDGFLKTFYKEMGEHYLKPHEAGLRSAFARIRSTVPEALEDIDEMRRLFRDKRQARAEGNGYGTIYKEHHKHVPTRKMVEGDL
jgi:hypothetical protein